MMFVFKLFTIPFFGPAYLAGAIWQIVRNGFVFGREECEELFESDVERYRKDAERATLPQKDGDTK